MKDRAASAIVADAQARGLLGNGKGLLDATSGNTGIAYAMLGAALGFPVTLCVPSNVSPERKNILAAYGAKVVWTNPADGSDGAIRKARELARPSPTSTSMPTSMATRELAGALPHDRQRDLGADRGADDALRGRAGDQRNVHGNDAAAARAESGDQVHLDAAGLAVQRAGGVEAYGDGDRAADL